MLVALECYHISGLLQDVHRCLSDLRHVVVEPPFSMHVHVDLALLLMANVEFGSQHHQGCCGCTQCALFELTLHFAFYGFAIMF